MYKSILALILISIAATSHASTLWLEGKIKGVDGEIVCVYKKGFDKVYVESEIGGYCQLAIVDND